MSAAFSYLFTQSEVSMALSDKKGAIKDLSCSLTLTNIAIHPIHMSSTSTNKRTEQEVFAVIMIRILSCLFAPFDIASSVPYAR